MAHIDWLFNSKNEEISKPIKETKLYYIIMFNYLCYYSFKLKNFSLNIADISKDENILFLHQMSNNWTETFIKWNSHQINTILANNIESILNFKNFQFYNKIYNKIINSIKYCIFQNEQFENIYFFISDEEMIQFIKNLEKIDIDILIAPGNSKNKEIIKETFYNMFEQKFLKSEEFNKLYFIEKTKIMNELNFIEKNIFKIINSFKNNFPDMNELYHKIIKSK